MAWRKKEETNIPIVEGSNVVPSKEKLEEEIKALKAEIADIKNVPDIEPKEPKAPIVKSRIIVVKELPMQEIRTGKDKDGTIINFITIEEALTNIMNA